MEDFAKLGHLGTVKEEGREQTQWVWKDGKGRYKELLKELGTSPSLEQLIELMGNPGNVECLIGVDTEDYKFVSSLRAEIMANYYQSRSSTSVVANTRRASTLPEYLQRKFRGELSSIDLSLYPGSTQLLLQSQ